VREDKGTCIRADHQSGKKQNFMETTSSPVIGWARVVTHENFYLGYKSTLPFRGGDWGNTSTAGVFALNMNESRANSNWNVGFRAALPS